jgi:hypothetical protein
MPNTLSQSELKRLQVLGAQARIEALRAEIESIVDNFPELAKGNAGLATSAKKAAGAGQGRRRNWNMSAAQRRAVSARMKKYWAARRKEKAAKATAKAS